MYYKNKEQKQTMKRIVYNIFKNGELVKTKYFVLKYGQPVALIYRRFRDYAKSLKAVTIGDECCFLENGDVIKLVEAIKK